MNAACMMMKIPDEFAIDSNATMKIAAWRGLSEFCMITRDVLAGGNRQAFFVGPAISFSRGNGAWFNAKTFTPLRSSQALSVHSQINAVGFMIGLLCHRRPSAIARVVMAGIIDPVNRVLWRWSRRHVFLEILKYVPPLTNLSALTAIFRVSAVVDLMAASHDRPPSSIKWRTILAGLTMSQIEVSRPFGVDLAVKTAAGSGITVPQRLAPRQGFIPAITDTMPSRHVVFFGVRAAPKYQKATKFLASQIDEFSHLTNMAYQQTFVKVNCYGI